MRTDTIAVSTTQCEQAKLLLRDVLWNMNSVNVSHCFRHNVHKLQALAIEELFFFYDGMRYFG